MDVEQVEERSNIACNNQIMYEQAYTHSSYVNDHRKEALSDQERLEFLGAAVLELGISQYLYKQHPHMPEGEMTKLRASIVCAASLVNSARDLQFGDYMLLGRGEEQTGGRNRPALLADAFESFLGALYLDQGLESVLGFLDQYVFPTITTVAFSHGMDYKCQLQA